MKTDLKTELKHWIDQETDIKVLEEVRAIFNQKPHDSTIEKEMVSRALRSEQDIKEGNVYSIDEVKTRLGKRFSK